MALRRSTGKCHGPEEPDSGCYICIPTDFPNLLLTPSTASLCDGVEHPNMSASVAVYRSIYTEDRFKQAYGSGDDASDGSLRLRERLAGRCSCSRRACLHLLRERLPIVGWLPRYRLKKWILGDTVAGLTVGILHIPQGGSSRGRMGHFYYYGVGFCDAKHDFFFVKFS